MKSEEPIVEVKVTYKGMHSTLWIDLSEYENKEHYLAVIKDHINVAKNAIDKQMDTVP